MRFVIWNILITSSLLFLFYSLNSLFWRWDFKNVFIIHKNMQYLIITNQTDGHILSIVEDIWAKGTREVWVVKELYLCTNPVSKTRISFLKIEFDIYVLDQASTSAPVKCSRAQNNILIFLAVRWKCSIKYTSHLQDSWLH